MFYCDSKNWSRKTLASYEQTLKLFRVYLEKELKITDINKVKSVHIRQYVKYLRERGKYTVVSSEKSRKINHPDHRHDFNKSISESTVANYLRNIKVVFNLFESEREIKINPVSNIKNIKPKRKQKALLDVEEIRRGLESTLDLTVFHSYR
ncbi:site-specific integrase [Metabacillus niabensis]|uniref:site-specific integrase n=1 Tax=Metabacillus niabensis TaxID=324854 RepID=UPI002278E52B|nr:site-specific integrase [Metabacillus niabensis]